MTAAAERRRLMPASLFVGLVAGTLALAILGAILPSYYVGLLTEALILAIFAMSLDLLLGYTGLPSLGHAAFFGAGGYGVAILSIKLGLDWSLALPCAMVLGLALAALSGLLVLRTGGVFFLMITLATAQVLWAIAFGWRDVTGGDDGLPGVLRPDFGIESFALSNTENFFYLILVIFVLSTIAMFILTKSPFGLAIRGIRDSESRMQALGYNVWLHKYIVFIVSGGFATLAGIAMAYYKRFVSPENLSVAISAEALLMVILGGAGTLFGSVVGALVIVALSNFISAFTDRWVLILGLIYVLVVVFAPTGVVGEIRSRIGGRA
jgi:branched-chain amino acid transport system permease protein